MRNIFRDEVGEQVREVQRSINTKTEERETDVKRHKSKQEKKERAWCTGNSNCDFV